MPDADGKFKGISVPPDAWERVFGNPAAQQPTNRGCLYRCAAGSERCDGRCCKAVPTEPDPEVDFDDPGFERADHRAARDGYNPW